jgi:Fe-S cluster assembly iron-binding protein IscA
MIEKNGRVLAIRCTNHGVKLSSIRSAFDISGAEVDFVDTVTGGGFTSGTNATSTCGCGSSFTAE